MRVQRNERDLVTTLTTHMSEVSPTIWPKKRGMRALSALREPFDLEDLDNSGLASAGIGCMGGIPAARKAGPAVGFLAGFFLCLLN